MFLPIAILAFEGAAQADPHEMFASAVAPWIQCASNRGQLLVSGTDTAEAIGDASVAACQEEEARFQQTIAPIVGDAAAARMARRSHEQLRQRIIRLVNETRGLVPRENDPAVVYSLCVEARATEIAHRREPVEILIDMALAHCTSEEAAMRDFESRSDRAARVEESMTEMHAIVRSRARLSIQRAREAR